jgi:hypothetical protein
MQTRDTSSPRGVEGVKLGRDVPPVITMAALVSAESRRDDAVVPKLIDAEQRWLDVDDLVWDRGYSQLRPETTTHPLNQAGIAQTFRMMGWQRQSKPFDEHTVMIEGRLVSVHAPQELQGLLPMPPYGSTDEQCQEYESAYNRLAQYALQRRGHGRASACGTSGSRTSRSVASPDAATAAPSTTHETGASLAGRTPSGPH